MTRRPPEFCTLFSGCTHTTQGGAFLGRSSATGGFEDMRSKICTSPNRLGIPGRRDHHCTSDEPRKGTMPVRHGVITSRLHWNAQSFHVLDLPARCSRQPHLHRLTHRLRQSPPAHDMTRPLGFLRGLCIRPSDGIHTSYLVDLYRVQPCSLCIYQFDTDELP